MYLIDETVSLRTHSKLLLLIYFLLASLKIPLHIKSQTITREGEEYLQINSIDSSVQILGDFNMDFKLDTFVPEMLRNFLNEQANCNWMQFKPQLERDAEKYISEIVCKVLTALLEKVPIRNFLLL